MNIEKLNADMFAPSCDFWFFGEAFHPAQYEVPQLALLLCYEHLKELSEKLAAAVKREEW